jgi:peptidoglycan/LPS O-acetylase OafA/YrhL
VITTASPRLTQVLNLGLLLLVAVLSYRYFERYFLQLKDRFART